MLKAVIYARFSSDMQREESIEAQIRACQEYCNKKHYQVTKIYTDEAKSGTKLIGRDAYNQMMDDAHSHAFDVIIFHKIDRNARNEFDYYTTKHELTRLGIGYEYAVQNIDDSPEGQMMENMLVGFAAYYSRNLAKETKKGLNENAYKAQFNGGRPPFGYRIEDKRYVVDEREAEGVRMIFSMYLAGNGYTKICHALKANGYKTHNGKDFSKNSIFDLLSNEKYIGVYTFNKVVKQANGKRNSHGKPSAECIRVENAIPAIISKEDFYMVQDKKTKNKGMAAKFRAREKYLLTGKIFCGTCGSAMNGHRITKKNGMEYAYYVCSKKERQPGIRCDQTYLPKENVENWVITTIEENIFAPATMKKLAEKMQREYENHVGDSKAALQRIEAEERAALRKLDSIYECIEAGGADEFEFRRLRVCKDNIRAIRERKEQAKNVAAVPVLSAEEITATLSALKADLNSGKQSDVKQFLVDLFVKKITVNEKTLSMQLCIESVAYKLVPRTQTQPIGYTSLFFAVEKADIANFHVMCRPTRERRKLL